MRKHSSKFGFFASSRARKTIDNAIKQLPPAQQEVVTLRDVHGWTADEVCNTLGISSVNQRVLLHRGRTALRTILEEHFADA